MQTISEEAAYTLQFINQTQRSIFLTGKAGTGKTTLLREIIATTHKNTVVVAPTGIAALNAGGVTIHSMFQIPFGGFIPEFNVATNFSETLKFETKDSLRRQFKMSGTKKAVIRNMELLIIDEVSMLRPDLLDAIDFMMQAVRRKSAPFGGVQVLYIGDLLQLPPVIRDNELQILRSYYQGKFFFHSQVVLQNPPIYIELSKIFRQTDTEFISVLNNLRNNTITNQDIAVLNRYVNPNFDLKANKGYITLTTHNAKADEMNAKALEALKGELISYKPEIVGDFSENMYPLEANLQLKVGAQVMFVKNDTSSEKNYFNGKMGQIKSLSSQEIRVHFPDENKTIEVDKYEWQNIRYNVNPVTKDIEEEILGTFVHYPIKLAWAITVHKSQGLTFDKAAIDVSRVFMPGQAYVALSRLRSLNGLVLLSPLQMNGISNDQDVMDYATNKASDDDLKRYLQKETHHFIHNYLITSFDWSDLAQEWRNHKFSYAEISGNTEKSKHALWANKQLIAIDSLLDASKKFILQLNKIFNSESVDLNFVSERIKAAYAYFFKPMDDLVFEVFWKLEEIKRIPKMKAFFEELSLLEDLQTKAVLKLMKAKLLIETVAAGEVISKENLTSDEIKKYIIRKKEAVESQFKKMNLTIIEDDKEVQRYISKKKSGNKTTMKSTFEETLDLWTAKNTIQDIARIRKLTISTIESHFEKLILKKQIDIQDLFSSNKIQELQLVFKDYNEESLSVMKEQLGEKFSWGELRIFRASLNESQS